MEQDILDYFGKARKYMDDAIEHLKNELIKVRAGKASPSMLNGILVEYYDNPTPLNQVATINSTDSKTLIIAPWEKKMLAPIEQALFAANLGITPMNDGETIRISLPPLTEDRRKDLVKQIKQYAEDGKVSLRHARHKVLDFIKKAVKDDGYPEDAGKRKEADVKQMIESYADKIEKLIEAKEKDIMTI